MRIPPVCAYDILMYMTYIAYIQPAQPIAEGMLTGIVPCKMRVKHALSYPRSWTRIVNPTRKASSDPTTETTTMTHRIEVSKIRFWQTTNREEARLAHTMRILEPVYIRVHDDITRRTFQRLDIFEIRQGTLHDLV